MGVDSHGDENINTEELFNRMRRRMRSLRKSLCMTQEEIARICKLSTHQYGEVERGRSRSNVFTLSLIARAFGVSLDYLVTGEPTRPDPKITYLQSEFELLDPNQLGDISRYLTAMQESLVLADENEDSE